MAAARTGRRATSTRPVSWRRWSGSPGPISASGSCSSRTGARCGRSTATSATSRCTRCRTAASSSSTSGTTGWPPRDTETGTPGPTPSASVPLVEDYTNKYKGEQVEIALFGGEYQDGVLTAYCYLEDVAHVELNGHILIPLQNVASLHCSSRCDAPEPDWPPRGLAEEEDPGEADDEA